MSHVITHTIEHAHAYTVGDRIAYNDSIRRSAAMRSFYGTHVWRITKVYTSDACAHYEMVRDPHGDDPIADRAPFVDDHFELVEPSR